MKVNNPIVGFIIGLAGPLIGITILKFMWFKNDEFGDYISRLSHSHDMAFKVVSLALLVNLLPFLLFNNKRYDNASRGIVVATMLYAVFIILVRYVW